VSYVFVRCSYESPGYELHDLEQGTFFTASSVYFVDDVSLEGHGRRFERFSGT
jgi:hypothetical protein